MRISASDETRGRNNNTSTAQTRLQASLMTQKHCAIRPHVPAGLGFRQGQVGRDQIQAAPPWRGAKNRVPRLVTPPSRNEGEIALRYCQNVSGRGGRVVPRGPL